MATPVSTLATAQESTVSAVSWPAVLAGAAASLALAMFLLSLGTGLGFSVVSPWPGEGVSATTATIAAGIYLLVVSVMANAVGGYIAGRLRTKWAGLHADEVYFRDTAHGFLAWAVAAVLGTAVLAAAATHLAAGASAGASLGATQVASASPSAIGTPMDGSVDRLLRGDPGRTASTSNPEYRAASRAELARIFAAAATGNEIAADDRSYAAQVIAARTGLSREDAERRVAEVANQVRAAADRARKATRNMSLWMAAAMLLGAFSGALAATEGGALRDGTWAGLRRRPA